MLSLSSVSVGKTVKLLAFGAGIPALYRKNLLAMGVIPGVVMRVISRSPFGGPIKIELRGYQLSLRPAECENITVEDPNECCTDQIAAANHCACG